jgi:hypothetical protein
MASIPPTQPPQNPINLYMTVGTTPGNYTVTPAGTATPIVTNSATPLKDILNALTTANTDPSTLVTLWSVSGNPVYRAQMGNLPNGLDTAPGLPPAGTH